MKVALKILAVLIVLPLSYTIWLFVCWLPVMGTYRLVVGAQYYDSHPPAVALRIVCYVLASILAFQTTRRIVKRIAA
jgi:hypothetical protein